MILSAEQLEIIFCENETIFVEALAGTGKTSTLIEFAKERFDLNILYIVFNKEMKKESKNKFPANTEVHTINSFSYKYIDGNFKNLTNNLNELKIIEILKLNKSIENFKKAKQILQEFNIAMSSDIKIENQTLNYQYEINYIYNLMISKKIKITHNAIMKHFIDNTNFKNFNYDYILIDEAQDINPEMLTIINKINSKKVFVGDIKQNIYKFRNTINIFNRKHLYKNSITLKLTKSYRFGEELANFITKTTSIAYNQDFFINGNEKITTKIIKNDNNIKKGFLHAYISRTNAELFEKAFELTKNNIKVSIPFNWEEIKILINSLFNLKIGLINKIENKEIKSFKSYDSFKEYAKISNDPEFSFLLKIIEKHGITIKDKLNILEQNLSSPKYAETILLTAHKSKGLEFISVEIANDFKEYNYKTTIEEKNLIYVTLTRAKEKIYLNKDLSNFDIILK